jgi:XTP/dITP diphosphohydrolase
MTFVVASFNPDKLRELRELLELPGVSLVSLSEFPGASAPDEAGATLRENALTKARAAVTLTGLPAIADDTGLEVDALGGEPGVRSARFAGPAATYADNVRRLLEALAGVEPARRGARFRTVCAAGPNSSARGCWRAASRSARAGAAVSATIRSSKSPNLAARSRS